MSDTNADDKLIGFEYQFFYFLLSLLKMQTGDIVGFEVKEDVHSENNEKITLCQLKHTIQKTAENVIKNLTRSDIDLWKTLSLWTDIIHKSTNKIEFLNNTKFIFVSNKRDNKGNKFLLHFKSLKNSKNANDLLSFLISYHAELNENFKNKIEEYNLLSEDNKKQQTKPKKDKKIGYLDNILSLDEVILTSFFLQIEFLLDFNNIREEIKNEIRDSKYIKSNFRIEQSYNQLIGLLKDDFYEKVSKKEIVQYTQKEFSLKISSIFEKMRSEQIPFISEIKYLNDNTILERTFAKQLKDMGIEDDDIYEYDNKRLLTEKNLKELLQSNEIIQQDISDLDKNAIDNWNPKHKKKYIAKSNDNYKALELFYEILDIDLDLKGQKISLKSISNGQFIKLSDTPQIGWKYNWKQEYKNEE